MPARKLKYDALTEYERQYVDQVFDVVLSDDDRPPLDGNLNSYGAALEAFAAWVIASRDADED